MGTVDTFEREILDNRTKLLKFGIKRWGRTLSVDDIEDIVQETLLAGLLGSTNFRGESKVFTWLTGIFHNKASSFLARRSKLVGFDDAFPAESEEYWEASFSTEATQEQTLIVAEDTERVRRAVDKLPPRQREVVIQYYFDDTSVDEAAASLGMPPNTFKSNMFYARQALLRQLQPVA